MHNVQSVNASKGISHAPKNQDTEEEARAARLYRQAHFLNAMMSKQSFVPCSSRSREGARVAHVVDCDVTDGLSRGPFNKGRKATFSGLPKESNHFSPEDAR